MQRGNLIVKLIATFIKATQTLRERLFDEGFVNRVAAGFFSGVGQLLDQVQQPSRIAIGIAYDAVARTIGNIF